MICRERRHRRASVTWDTRAITSSGTTITTPGDQVMELEEAEQVSVEGSPSESFTCHEAEEERSSGGAGEEHGCSPWAMYQRSLQKRPLVTKSVTAAVVSALGELLGSALRPASTPPPSATGSTHQAMIQSRMLSTTAGAVRQAEPSLLRRVSAFALFGLVLNGPVFHWWYGALERAAARRRKPGSPPGGAGDIAFKLALDRFLVTPPYLALTLLSLRLLQGLGVKRSTTEMKMIYRGALVMNWKVWTLAQLINFKLVPVAFRPLFGNIVSGWWNIYLSLLSSK